MAEKWQHLIGKKIKDVRNDYLGTVLSNFECDHSEIQPGDAPVVYDFDVDKTVHPVPYFCLIEQ